MSSGGSAWATLPGTTAGTTGVPGQGRVPPRARHAAARHPPVPEKQRMEHTVTERTATIASRVGLHARPAAIFADAAGAMDLDVTIAYAGEPADEALDAASILSLMSLGASHGDVVVLRAGGTGAEEALEKLVKILETDHDAE